MKILAALILGFIVLSGIACDGDRTVNGDGNDNSPYSIGVGCYPSWSPDSKEMVVNWYDDLLEIITIETGARRQITFPPYPTNNDYGDGAPDWSPVSEWIVFESKGRNYAVEGEKHDIWKVSSLDGEVIQLTFSAESDMQESSPVWSPDGMWIAYIACEDYPDYCIYKIPAEGGDPITMIEGVRRGQIAWSPSGDRIVYCGSDGICVYEISAGSSETIVPSISGASLGSCAWSPNGDIIAYVESVWRSYAKIMGVAPEGGQPWKILEPLDTDAEFPNASDLDFSPDGQFLAFDVRISESVNEVWVYRMDD